MKRPDELKSANVTSFLKMRACVHRVSTATRTSPISTPK
jgi:hypothetical protein